MTYKEGTIYPVSALEMAKFDDALVNAVCAEMARIDKTPLVSNSARAFKDLSGRMYSAHTFHSPRLDKQHLTPILVLL